jgi:hypothetical protein
MLTPHGIPIQTPPNLSDMVDLDRLLAAGVSDWGGVSPVTADFVNPERAWYVPFGCMYLCVCLSLFIKLPGFTFLPAGVLNPSLFFPRRDVN